MNRRGHLKTIAAAAAVAAGALTFATQAQAQAKDTIKVGVLHSLSGTMAISETVLKDTVLMAIDEINAKGGVLGKKLEPWWWTRPPTGRCSPKRPSSCWARTRFPSSSVAGPVRVAQVGAAGGGRNERPAVLPCAVRG
jgi:hypothetical protein